MCLKSEIRDLFKDYRVRVTSFQYSSDSMHTRNTQAQIGLSATSFLPAGDTLLRRIFLIFMLFSFVFALPGQGRADTNPKYASIVIDGETGAVISEKYADKKLHPASLTKVMTLLLLFEAMESGRVRLNDKIMISQHAAAQQPSKIGLPAGSSIRVEDAILALVTKSANDISVAIAEHLAGTESRFAERMTYRAQTIGMTKTVFKNAHGLHHPSQITSARDMATLARYVIYRYPNYYRYFSTKQFTYRGKTYTNHNRLMQTYPGMDGFKTGFINASGFNLIASAKKNDKRLIGVVFGGRSWKTRNDHMAELLNAGFNRAPGVRGGGIAVAELQQPASNFQQPVAPPPAKPVFRTDVTPPNETTSLSYTSLASLNNNGTKVVVENTQKPAQDITEEAIASARGAVNRGEYSELIGEGDYDAATMRRVETGLIAAAVYKGEAQHVRQIAATSDARVLDQPKNLDQQLQARQEDQTATPQPAAFAPPATLQAAHESWSIQIGAYTSRVATDDALRRARSKLPPDLSHSTALVVPLTSNHGTLFRARIGNFTQAQAQQACRYFRDCLPIAP